MENKSIKLGIYTLGGGIGSWAKSRERVPLGTTRVIGEVLMYAWAIYPRGLFRKPEVNWSPVDREYCTYENLRAWLVK